MLMAPPPTTKEEFIVRFSQTWKVLRAGSFPEDEALRSSPRRTHLSSAGSIRPASAGSSAPSSPPAAARSGCTRSRRRRWSFTAPSIRWCIPMGGKDTAASIPGAKLLMIEGMGHALPIPMWPEIIDAIDKHAHAASAKVRLVQGRSDAGG